MAYLIESDKELLAFYNLIDKIREYGFKSSRYLELTNCLVSIDYSEKGFNDFLNFKNDFLFSVGETAQRSFDRADRVYNSGKDRITKPNYFKRINSFEEIYNGDKIEIDQMRNIIYELSEKPKHSLLTFSIFRPIDLINKKRPGYVPCPIAGDFKFRNKKLQLNILFRSNDALNFFYPDVFYLRSLQKYVLQSAKELTSHKSLREGKIGSLNLHFSRVFLPLRMEMKKKEYINASEIELKISNLKAKLVQYL